MSEESLVSPNKILSKIIRLFNSALILIIVLLDLFFLLKDKKGVKFKIPEKIFISREFFWYVKSTLRSFLL